MTKQLYTINTDTPTWSNGLDRGSVARNKPGDADFRKGDIVSIEPGWEQPDEQGDTCVDGPEREGVGNAGRYLHFSCLDPYDGPHREPTRVEDRTDLPGVFKLGDKVRFVDPTTIGNYRLSAKDAETREPLYTYTGDEVLTIEEISGRDGYYVNVSVEVDGEKVLDVDAWNKDAFVLVNDEEEVARPLIDFSKSRYATARAYASELRHAKVGRPGNEVLTAVVAGDKVDAYELAEAVLQAARSAANRGHSAQDRNSYATKAGHLGHIAHATLRNHADKLPAYAAGERSRAVEQMKEAVSHATDELDAVTTELRSVREELDTATRAHEANYRGMTESFQAQIRMLEAELADANRAIRHRTMVTDYAHELLATDEKRAMLDGFFDGSKRALDLEA